MKLHAKTILFTLLGIFALYAILTIGFLFAALGLVIGSVILAVRAITNRKTNVYDPYGTEVQEGKVLDGVEYKEEKVD